MILEDEAGYYAVMLPLKRIPEYRFQVINGGSRKRLFMMLMNSMPDYRRGGKSFCAGVYYKAYKKLGAHPVTVEVCKEHILLSGHPMQSV